MARNGFPRSCAGKTNCSTGSIARMEKRPVSPCCCELSKTASPVSWANVTTAFSIEALAWHGSIRMLALLGSPVAFIQQSITSSRRDRHPKCLPHACSWLAAHVGWPVSSEAGDSIGPEAEDSNNSCPPRLKPWATQRIGWAMSRHLHDAPCVDNHDAAGYSIGQWNRGKGTNPKAQV